MASLWIYTVKSTKQPPTRIFSSRLAASNISWGVFRLSSISRLFINTGRSGGWQMKTDPDVIVIGAGGGGAVIAKELGELDRKSTRLNSSHVSISYAVFC